MAGACHTPVAAAAARNDTSLFVSTALRHHSTACLSPSLPRPHAAQLCLRQTVLPPPPCCASAVRAFSFCLQRLPFDLATCSCSSPKSAPS
jgi:hypothetical protein